MPTRLPQQIIRVLGAEHVPWRFSLIQMKTYNFVLRFLLFSLWVHPSPHTSVILTGGEEPLSGYVSVCLYACVCLCRIGKNACDLEKYYLILYYIWKIITGNAFTTEIEKQSSIIFLPTGDIQERNPCVESVGGRSGKKGISSWRKIGDSNSVLSKFPFYFYFL